MSIFQGKFPNLEEGNIVEFRFVKIGNNGSSLTVGYQSSCTIIDDNSVRDVFMEHKIYDQEIVGVIDGYQGMSFFKSCDNCRGSIQELDSLCKTCKKQQPTGEDTFR